MMTRHVSDGRVTPRCTFCDKLYVQVNAMASGKPAHEEGTDWVPQPHICDGCARQANALMADTDRGIYRDEVAADAAEWDERE